MNPAMTAEQHHARGCALLAQAATAGMPYSQASSLAQRAQGHFAAAVALGGVRPVTVEAEVDEPGKPGHVTVRLSGTFADVQYALDLINRNHVHLDDVTTAYKLDDSARVYVRGLLPVDEYRETEAKLLRAAQSEAAQRQFEQREAEQRQAAQADA